MQSHVYIRETQEESEEKAEIRVKSFEDKEGTIGREVSSQTK
jgi:hypothetical protein